LRSGPIRTPRSRSCCTDSVAAAPLIAAYLVGVRPFLTANWRYLAMLNYVVDPKIVASLVPLGTEIDFENGETFLSVVGFLFLDTRLLGLSIPLHRDFEEVNLRFYVRKKSADTWRRGAVFVSVVVAANTGSNIAFGKFGLRKRSSCLRMWPRFMASNLMKR